MPLFAGVYRPKAAVAGGVLQVFSGVGSAEKDASAGQFLNVAPVRRTETIRTEAQKLLNAAYIGTPESIKLRYLHKPNALEQFACLFTLEGADAVIKPATAHFIQQGAFTDTLRARQNNHIVILAAGCHSTGNGGGKGLAGYGPVVCRIFCAEVVYKKAIEARHSIPLALQALEVVLYIVKSVGVGMEGKSPIHFAVAGNLIHTLKVPVKPLVIVIIPHAAFFPFIPRQGAEHLTTVGKLVEGKLAFKQGIVLQDNTHIVNGGFNSARLGVFFEQHHPIFRLLALISGDAVKVLNGTLVPFSAYKCANIRKPAGILTHSSVRGQAVGGCASLCLIVCIRKFVEAYQVKCIYELAGAGIRCVVAV